MKRLATTFLFLGYLISCDPTVPAGPAAPLCPSTRTEIRLASCAVSCAEGAQIWSLCSAEPVPYFYTAPGVHGPYSVGYELGPASAPGACGDVAVTTRNLRSSDPPPAGLVVWPCSSPNQKLTMTPEMTRDREYYSERHSS